MTELERRRKILIENIDKVIDGKGTEVIDTKGTEEESMELYYLSLDYLLEEIRNQITCNTGFLAMNADKDTRIAKEKCIDYMNRLMEYIPMLNELISLMEKEQSFKLNDLEQIDEPLKSIKVIGGNNV